MGMVTELEIAIWAAAEPLRKTMFARILRNARLGNRDPSLPGPDDQFQGWSLSFDPAVHRSIAASYAIGFEVGRSPDLDSDWARWNLAAKRAVCRLAAKCWAGTDRDRRIAFVDEDNLHPVLGRAVFHDLRADSLGPHLAFEGLGDGDAWEALRQVFRAARATATYDAVQAADRQLSGSRSKLKVWASLGTRGRQRIAAALAGRTFAEGTRLGVEEVQSLYEGTEVEDIAGSFRRYNQLVQAIVWSILGLAEEAIMPATLRSPIGTLYSSLDSAGAPLLQVSTSEDHLALLRLTNPLWVEAGMLLDGLYVVVGSTTSFGHGEMMDFSLRPLRWMAGAWP